MKGLCGKAIHRTRRLDLVWRVSVAHSNSWYQITERGYFGSNGRKEAGPLMKEADAILLAGRLLEDALSHPWLKRAARKAIDRVVRRSKKRQIGQR